MESLSRSGAVISEFPPGTAPERKNFPRRNRLISGLSMGVLVVEATQDSGSLITAQYALEQGKEVFSVPGNVDSGFSRGTNELIKQGARLITSSRDILQELAPQLGEPPGSPGQEAPRGPALSPQQARLCELLSQGPRHVDELARALGMEAQSLLRMLLELELQGLVRQAPGKRFYLC
jgi:DNA processing protein